jgi:GTP-binding protein
METQKENLAGLPVVSIVGRPNVGKSCLFNRILGKKVAVVDDIPGVTRDRNYRNAVWSGCAFSLVDTGGLVPLSRDEMVQDIARQVAIACDESTVVLFLVDAKNGVTDTDMAVARVLRKQAKGNVLLVVNKTESKQTQYDIGAFQALGLGEGYAISALHGYGVGDMLDETVALLKRTGNKAPKSAAFPDERDVLKIAVVGRPNAGKSSLVNKLLGHDRMIVRPEAGTTRDSIDSRLQYDGHEIMLIDTAGLRKKANVKDDVEYYCNLRAIESIGRCDVAVLMVDTTLGLHEQDMRIVRQIVDMRKGLLVCWNKWDLVAKTHTTFDHLTAQTRKTYREIAHAPMVSSSAITGQRVNTVVDRALEIKKRMETRIDPIELAAFVKELGIKHPHPITANRQISIRSCVQAQTSFPLFHVVSTNPRNALPNYKRFLANNLYDTYGFDGCPVVVDFVPVRKPSFPNAAENSPTPSLKGDVVP